MATGDLKTTKNAAIELLAEIQHLMELAGENPFKVRAFEKVQGVLENQSDSVNLTKLAREKKLTEISGIGKGIEQILTEFLLEGKSTVRDELKADLPPGLLELTQVPGLGPKKARVVIDELKITTLGELEYACRENRLLHLQGFGEKLQAKILENLIYLRHQQGKKLLPDALHDAKEVMTQLKKIFKKSEISETGALRRRLEVISELEFLIAAESEKKLKPSEFKTSLPVTLHYADPKHWGYAWAKTTGSDAHWKALGSPKPFAAKTEADFYAHLGCDWIAPELRETGEEVKLAKSKQLEKLVSLEKIQGLFHMHTVASDGIASLEEMVREAKHLGYRYVGISDHSQSAFYAKGLKADALKAQEKEVRAVQEKYPDMKIFWGIESDILADGSLDYDAKTLSRFDFVIASIHSRFGMDKKAMTDRIVKAIRNPKTRFIGHLTGRLLLGRPGYDLDFETIFEEAASHDVAIELNAHPSRLDVDWHWGEALRKSKVKISINPDAHELQGLQDTQYGVLMARKALLSESQVINTKTVKEVSAWLKRSP